MATVADVAAYILTKEPELTAMKLQKLCYYAQAWHLVWDEKPLFGEPIQAWANGPVAPVLYYMHQGKFRVKNGEIAGHPEQLLATETESIDSVIDFYGHYSAAELSELTHAEAPWRDARGTLPPGSRSNTEITHAAMAEYYGSLV